MTGFGRASGGPADAPWQAEVRAVNHRYLDLVLHVPENCRGFEEAIRQLVSQHVRRGRVEVALMPPPGLAPAPSQRLVVDMSLVAQYHEALQEIGARWGAPAAPNAGTLLALPGVARLVPVPGPGGEETWPPLEEALGAALADMVAMREREGHALGQALADLVTRLDRLRTQVAEAMPGVRRTQISRWRARLDELGAFPGEDARQVRLPEIMERGDLTEELERLQSHMRQVRTCLEAREPVGRRLDFLAQELLREWGTVAAKAVDAETASWAVEARVTVEQFREQVQNVE